MFKVTFGPLRTAVLLIFTAHGLNAHKGKHYHMHVTFLKRNMIKQKQVLYVFHRTAAPAPIRHLTAGGVIGTLRLLIWTNYCFLEIKKVRSTSKLSIYSGLI